MCSQHSNSSIILDATKYIQELKQKVVEMNQEIMAGTVQKPFAVVLYIAKLAPTLFEKLNN